MEYKRDGMESEMALWSRTTKNPDVSTEPLARPFARLLALLTQSLAPPYLLRLRAPLHSLICLLARSLLFWTIVERDGMESEMGAPRSHKFAILI